MYDPEQYDKAGSNGNEVDEATRTRRNRSRSRSPLRTRSRSRSRSPREWKRSERSHDRDRSDDREHRHGRDIRTRLYVCNMPYDIRWQDIKDLFREKIGPEAVHVEMYKDQSGKQCGAAAIEVRSQEIADKAIDLLHKYEIRERQIIVRMERDKDRRRHQMGGGGSGMGDMGVGGMRGGMMGHQGGGGGGGGGGHGGNMGPMGGGGMGMGLGMAGSNPPNMGGGANLVSSQLLNQLGIDPNNITNQVFVANLDYKVTSNKLKEIFSMAGNVVQAEIKEDKDGKSRGLGTAHFQHPMEAVQAISMFNNQILYDRSMIVRLDKMASASMPQQIPSKLPVGLKGVGMGLGAGGAPLQNISQLVGTLGSLGNLASSIGSLSSLGNLGGNIGGNQGLGLLSGLGNLGGGLGAGNLGGNLNSLSSQIGSIGSSGLAQQSLGGLGGLAGGLGGNQLGGGLGSLATGIGGNSGAGSMTSMAGGGIGNLASSLNSLAQSIGSGGGGGGSLASHLNTSDLGGGSGNLSRSLAALGGDSGLSGNLAGLGSLHGGLASGLMGNANMNDERDLNAINFNRGGRMDNRMDNRMDTRMGGHDDNRMSNASRTVVVKNLPYTVTWQELKDKFQECGEVKFAEIKLEMGRSKGQGTVRFNTPDEAKRACDRMYGARVGGRELVVRLEG